MSETFVDIVSVTWQMEIKKKQKDQNGMLEARQSQTLSQTDSAA